MPQDAIRQRLILATVQPSGCILSLDDAGVPTPMMYQQQWALAGASPLPREAYTPAQAGNNGSVQTLPQ